MEILKLSDIDIYDVGNQITLYGAIYHGKGKVFLVPLPDQAPVVLKGELTILDLGTEEMERFLNQSDVLDVRGPGKAILRKSQRHIDKMVQWKVFERDDYKCRYCGKRVPLTVDHVILWEDGGATVEDNLVSACGKCNKLRGSTEYDKWITSRYYKEVSEYLDPKAVFLNLDLIMDLPRLRAIVTKPRSR